MECNANHSRMKHVKEGLKKLESSHMALRIINFDMIKDKVDRITILGKKVILLENNKEYLAHI